jgi:hypothetical protein
MILIKGIASVTAAMLIGLSAPSARAGYVVDLTQQGSDVVATGSGAVDLTGLTFNAQGGAIPQIAPGKGLILTGSKVFGVDSDVYMGFTGPASFGNGDTTLASSGSGGIVGLFASLGVLWVPLGYVSDKALSDTAIYDNQTFTSLGVTPGTYKWTWGDGANQNLTLVIGTVVPEPSTWAMMLIGFAGLGFMGYQSASRQRRTAGDA